MIGISLHPCCVLFLFSFSRVTDGKNEPTTWPQVFDRPFVGLVVQIGYAGLQPFFAPFDTSGHFVTS